MIQDKLIKRKGNVSKRIENLDIEIQSLDTRIDDLRERKKAKIQEREELKNSLIVEIIRERNITPEQLAEILNNQNKLNDLPSNDENPTPVSVKSTRTIDQNNLNERKIEDEEDII